MKRTLSFFLAVFMLLLAVLSFTSCGHTHNFSTEWSGNETHHWHDCKSKSCEEISDMAKHTYDNFESLGDTEHKGTCTVCGAETTDSHTWGEGEITTQPTPDTDGVETFRCTGCDATKTQSIAYGHTHDYGEWESVSGTQHKKVCECGAEVVESHDFENDICTACGYAETEAGDTLAATVDPYANVDWATAETVKSMTHWHINTQQMFEIAVADGYRHFAVTDYQPSRPKYPLSDFYSNVPNDILGSPNSEKVFTTEFGGNVHFNALGSFAEGHGHTNRNKVPWRTAFEEIFAALQYPDGGGITLNHPVYPKEDPTSIYHFMEMLDYDERVLGIEIYNSGSIRHLPMWDIILSTGRRCWGFAVIDWYNADRENRTYGSNLLLVPAFTEEDCLKAYRNGEFYAQLKDTGLRFTELKCEGGVVSVGTNRETVINFISTNGEVVKTVTGTSASYTVSEDDVYVRVEAMEADDETSRIFSNPFMFKTREEVAAAHDGALDLSLGECAWDIVGSNTENSTATTVVWEKDGVYTATEPTDLADYTKYTIEWYNYGAAGPNLDGTAYVIERQVKIKSIKEGDSEDEATITWGGVTYAAGNVVYRNGQNCWLGLDAFKAPNVISSVFAPAPGITPIAKAGEIASFEADIKIDLGDYHKSGGYYTLGKVFDLVIREGSTNKATSSFTVSGTSENYVDMKSPGADAYYTENVAARGKVGEVFTVKFEIFWNDTKDAYVVKTYFGGILIGSTETPVFDVSNVKIEGISAAAARDLVITVSNVKFLKYTESYDKHIHTFKTEWSSDSEYHWHEPTCDEYNSCSPTYLSGDKAMHADSNSDGKCDVCQRVMRGVISVSNPDNLAHTVPTTAVEAGDTVTFTVSIDGDDSVGVLGATQVGEPTVDGTTKTYTFTIESIDPSVTLKIYRLKAGCVNRIDYSTLTTSAEDYKTTYVKISGDTVTEGTPTSYDYVIVWQYKTLAGPSLDGESYTIGRKVTFTSVKAYGSDEETSFTAGGVEYGQGSIPEADALLGTTFNGSSATLSMKPATALAAPETDSTLRLVWDTDLVVSAGTATGEQQLKVLYKHVTATGTSLTSTDAYDVIIRNGNNVYYKFASTKHLIGTVGNTVNIRVEIREITGVDTDTNDDGTVDYLPVEIKLFVNGELKATREDQIDAASGKYDTTPSEVSINPVKACRDEFVTLKNTYIDVYTAPEN